MHIIDLFLIANKVGAPNDPLAVSHQREVANLMAALMAATRCEASHALNK
jgi:hypothetical protein